MRNVIIWHWFIKNIVGTWRRNDVDATSLRRIDVVTTSCTCWEFAAPRNILKLAPLPTPPNILNLPTHMQFTVVAKNADRDADEMQILIKLLLKALQYFPLQELLFHF